MVSRAFPFDLACLALGCGSTPTATGGNAAGGSNSGGGNASTAGGTSGGAAAFVCDPNAKPKAASLRRLTTSQYGNTLGDFVASSLSDPADAAAVMTELEAPLKGLVNKGGQVAITTTAEITLYGKDQAGRDVSVKGFITVNFADFG